MRLVRFGLMALVLALCLNGAAQAQDVSPSDRAAIRDVITQQLDAFRRDDGPAAFAFAAPGIQTMFGTPQRFLDMVREAYPAVHRPRSADFSDLGIRDGVLVQEVELVGPGGSPETALYSMERDSAGHWRISGCTLVRSARIGT